MRYAEAAKDLFPYSSISSPQEVAAPILGACIAAAGAYFADTEGIPKPQHVLEAAIELFEALTEGPPK